MATARRRARLRKYTVKHGGAPRGSFYTGGTRRNDEAKLAANRGKGKGPVKDTSTLVLKLQIKPNGRWGYRFGALRRSLKRLGDLS